MKTKKVGKAVKRNENSLESRAFTVTLRLRSDIYELAKKKKQSHCGFVGNCVVSYIKFKRSGENYPMVDYDFAGRLLPKYERLTDWNYCSMSIPLFPREWDMVEDIRQDKRVEARDIIIDALVYTLALEYSKNIK